MKIDKGCTAADITKAKRLLREWRNGYVRAKRTNARGVSSIKVSRGGRLAITVEGLAYLFANHDKYERFINKGIK